MNHTLFQHILFLALGARCLPCVRILRDAIRERLISLLVVNLGDTSESNTMVTLCRYTKVTGDKKNNTLMNSNQWEPQTKAEVTRVADWTGSIQLLYYGVKPLTAGFRHPRDFFRFSYSELKLETQIPIGTGL